jgi:hypothetical protein
MKRVIKVLVVTALVAMILVASISPTMARRANFGHRMPTDTTCNDVPANPRNEGGAHHEDSPQGHTGCWVIVPGLNK